MRSDGFKQMVERNPYILVDDSRTVKWVDAL